MQLELLPGGVDEQPHRGRREGQPKTRPPELPDGRPNHWSCSIATCDWKVEENDFDAAITKLFEDMYPDHQDREHVWKAFGYGITGHAFERCLLVIEGETRSGKTTLTEPVHATLGPGYARVAASELLIRMSGKHSSVVADVIDARIVFIDDPYEGAKMDNNLVKQITGGDPVNTRRLYEQSHDSTVRMLPILVTNHVPGTHVLEAPIAERLHMTLTAGTVKLEKRDPLLKHKLKTDAGREAILRWLVRRRPRVASGVQSLPVSQGPGADGSRARDDLDVLADRRQAEPSAARSGESMTMTSPSGRRRLSAGARRTPHSPR